MTKLLTDLNREDKGDVDLALRSCNKGPLPAQFPSYFASFWLFQRFLVLPSNAVLASRRLRRKHEIPPATAIMAIV
jgi:hypothetical protein